jgi:hypothetical protein
MDKKTSTKNQTISIDWGTAPSVPACQPSSKEKSNIGWIVGGILVLIIAVFLLKGNGAGARNIFGSGETFIGDKNQKVLVDKDGNVIKDQLPPVVNSKKKSGTSNKNSSPMVYDYSTHDYSVKDSYNTTNPVEKETQTQVIEREVIVQPEIKNDVTRPEPIQRIEKKERSLENQGTDDSYRSTEN